MSLSDATDLAFIFDLDGTIVDSTAHYRATWAEFISEYGANEDAEQYLQRSTRENLRMLLGQNATDTELEQQAKRHAESGNAKMRANGIVAHDGVLELIHALHEHGFKIALATAAEKSNAEWTLEQLEIRPLFDAVVVDQDVAYGKPAPDIYLKAIERLGVDPQHCAVMEDSSTGTRAAKAAGLRVIAVITTHSHRELEQAGADLIVERATALTADDVIQFIRHQN